MRTGSTPNPRWNRSDDRNVHFLVALFGFHLILQLMTLTVGYLISYVAVRSRVRRRDVNLAQLQPLLLDKTDDTDA